MLDPSLGGEVDEIVTDVCDFSVLTMRWTSFNQIKGKCFLLNEGEYT